MDDNRNPVILDIIHLVGLTLWLCYDNAKFLVLSNPRYYAPVRNSIPVNAVQPNNWNGMNCYVTVLPFNCAAITVIEFNFAFLAVCVFYGDHLST